MDIHDTGLSSHGNTLYSSGVAGCCHSIKVSEVAVFCHEECPVGVGQNTIAKVLAVIGSGILCAEDNAEFRSLVEYIEFHHEVIPNEVVEPVVANAGTGTLVAHSQDTVQIPPPAVSGVAAALAAAKIVSPDLDRRIGGGFGVRSRFGIGSGLGFGQNLSDGQIVNHSSDCAAGVESTEADGTGRPQIGIHCHGGSGCAIEVNFNAVILGNDLPVDIHDTGLSSHGNTLYSSGVAGCCHSIKVSEVAVFCHEECPVGVGQNTIAKVLAVIGSGILCAEDNAEFRSLVEYIEFHHEVIPNEVVEPVVANAGTGTLVTDSQDTVQIPPPAMSGIAAALAAAKIVSPNLRLDSFFRAGMDRRNKADDHCQCHHHTDDTTNCFLHNISSFLLRLLTRVLQRGCRTCHHHSAFQNRSGLPPEFPELPHGKGNCHSDVLSHCCTPH